MRPKRQDGIILSDIGRASPTSQHLLDYPKCRSSKSPGSFPRDEPISKIPVRDNAQLDFSNHGNPKSSASVRDLDLSSPVLCPGVVASNYEPLIQGTWIERELPLGGPPVKLSTRLIHITLSCDCAKATYKPTTADGQQKKQEISRLERVMMVKVRWLGPEEEPKRGSEQTTNIVDLDDMDEHVEETLSHGAARSSTELYICRQVDMIAIKYFLKE